MIHTGDDSTVFGWVDQSDVESSGGLTKNDDTEFTRRGYKSYPYTEYVGIANGYNNGTHVVNEALMKKYGRIQQIVDFPEIEDPDELLEAAQEWLKTHSSFLKQTYEVSLVDLGRIYGTGLKPIHLLDRIHVSMPNHGIDEYMPVTKISMDLLNPVDTVVSFSKENTEPTSCIRTLAATLGKASVELNRSNDSISQSLARNVKYISQTDEHAKINTSLSLNTKNTLPDGMTDNVDVVTASGGTIKLTFVNGLLSANLGGTGPEYNFFDGLVIKGSGILRPSRNDMWLYVINDSGTFVGGKEHALIKEGLFGDRDFVTNAYIPVNDELLEVYNYPYYFSDKEPEADDLILETAYGSKEYGLYYRMVDGVKRYFAMPCIYYLPSNYTGDLYVFYVGPINMKTHLRYSWAPDPVMFTQKVANLGNITRVSTSVVQNNIMKPAFNDKILPKMKNKLKKLAQSNNSPSYTSVAGLVDINYSDYSHAPGTALLITPFYVEQAPYSYDMHSDSGLYVSPALVIESDDYTYINGVRRPNKIKLYTGYGNIAVPRDYYNGDSDAYMPDMFLEHNSYERDVVKTQITTAKYYIFSSKDDLNAIVNDYLEGNGTQSEIENRYKSKIVAFGNSYNTIEAQSKMRLHYRFNKKTTSYYVSGSYDPFYG